MQRNDPIAAQGQTTLDEQVAAATGDAPAQIAAAIAELRARRVRMETTRQQLADDVRDFNRQLAYCVEVGATYRELEEPSRLKKSYIGDVVQLVRENAAKAAAKACPRNLMGGK